jgi:hypothetical protein
MLIRSYVRFGCCQTNANQSQFPADGGIQAAPS